MTDIPDTHTFKPDYLCDPPCSYHDALQEQIEVVKRQSDRIEELEAELKRASVRRFMDEVKEAEAAERERLKPWLQHEPYCPRYGDEMFGDCTCGLDAALGEADD